MPAGLERGSGSGSASDSGSGSSWPRDTALQNAWSAGDRDAYNRIQSGGASWGDRSRYGQH